jgi:integrase
MAVIPRLAQWPAQGQARGLRLHLAGEREPEAIALLDACRASQNPYLAAMVTTALYTGARRGEILGLTWERVDFARGVLLFDRTKSGRRREVPMHEPVYRALAGLPGPAWWKNCFMTSATRARPGWSWPDGTSRKCKSCSAIGRSP